MAPADVDRGRGSCGTGGRGSVHPTRLAPRGSWDPGHARPAPALPCAVAFAGLLAAAAAAASAPLRSGAALARGRLRSGCLVRLSVVALAGGCLLAFLCRCAAPAAPRASALASSLFGVAPFGSRSEEPERAGRSDASTAVSADPPADEPAPPPRPRPPRPRPPRLRRRLDGESEDSPSPACDRSSPLSSRPRRSRRLRTARVPCPFRRSLVSATSRTVSHSWAHAPAAPPVPARVRGWPAHPRGRSAVGRSGGGRSQPAPVAAWLRSLDPSLLPSLGARGRSGSRDGGCGHAVLL